MIKKIISFSAHNKFLVIFLTILACLAGVYSLQRIPIDAIPDLSDTQVIIYSRWDRPPDVIENQVTYPIISGLLGAPHVKTIRGFTDFGYSYVYVIFEDGTDLYWARSRVLEYLSKITASLPEGVKTELGPDATSVGWVYQYALVDRFNKLNLGDLRAIQDWNLRFHLQSIPGVAEVASVGGFVKQYQIQIDPLKLQSYNLTLDQVLKSVRASNKESGGRLIEFSGTEAMVRSRGLITKIEDLEKSIVAFVPKTGASVLLKDVATIALGPEMRRGVTDLDGEGNTVGGIIVMRQGEKPVEVIDRVKDKLEELKPGLPQGVEVVTVYDRSDLITRALDTLKKSLIEEMIIVSLVILIFLWHIPSAIVPIVTIPVSVLLAFIPMYYFGFSSNVMSLAGIAISIGVLVDGAIVEVENAYKKIQHWIADGKKGDFHSVRLKALLEVGPSVFFSLLVIAVAFLPVFTLVDQEGRLFKPLAISKNLAMAIAAILAITLDPAMRMMFARSEPFHFKSMWLNKVLNPVLVGTYYPEEKHPISSFLHKIYEPVVRKTLKYKKQTLMFAGVLLLTTIPAFLKLGSEFMPTLHEGSLLYMPTALPGMSVTEAQRILQIQGQIIKSFPEVEHVFGKAGRAETSTDTAPVSMVETTITLKPRDQWPRWYSKYPKPIPSIMSHVWPDFGIEEDLVKRMNEALQFPGMPNIWTMPIKNRIDMLSTGIRSAVGIKIFGPDLKEIENIGTQVEQSLKSLDGIRTVIAERTGAGYYVDVDFDRDKLKLYGLTLEEAQDLAMVAIGGENVATTLSGRERYPIQVRLARNYRSTPDEIKNIQLTSSSGARLTLSQLAEVKISEGPSMIRDENALPVGYVFVDVDTDKTDIGSFVKEAKKVVQKSVKLPTGYSLSFSGQYENMIRVKERLKIVIPITLLLIVFLLYMNTRSWIKTGIVMLAVPFSVIGAVWIMLLLGYHSSIASWVGMIALMGLDAETGVFMLLYLDLAYEQRQKSGQMNTKSDLVEAIIEGAVKRIRPKLMTVAAAFLGLIPIMWSSGAGADVMKRIAAPMIGGLFTSFALELLIYPVIFYIWKEKADKLKENTI